MKDRMDTIDTDTLITMYLSVIRHMRSSNLQGDSYQQVLTDFENELSNRGVFFFSLQDSI
ncbi:hypothetical protein [Metabacillus arenae]|uniref:Uncharacterized protein n=1 Tax=Metabacillus arenae TaxID=2771434 RepID=A0A926S0R5_9BACI|nr:hypothetical protein [Metabacillus arenae]MBD1380284.1 hypothetical protein [Metabacillus arenae]